MRFTRLFSAITLVAAATVLASCGGSSTPTTTNTTDPSLALAPREFTLTPNSISWDRGLVGDPIPTDTKSVLIGGVIALATYPSFGTPVYSGGPGNWLDFDTSPTFQMSPMGWRVDFKLKPAAQNLPDGSYSATIPVTIPGALRNPQMITVSFGCHQLIVDGPFREGNLTASTPTKWNRNSTINNSGSYPYQDWCVVVPPATSVFVWQQGGYPGCPGVGLGYTLYDSYLYVFTTPGDTYVTQDDDRGCGYDSVVRFTNPGSTPQHYRVRSTDYASSEYGTYRVQANSYDASGYYYSDLRMGDASGTAKVKIVPPSH